MRKQPQKRIELLAAMASVSDQPALEMTLTELVMAFGRKKCDGSDIRLRKWTDAYGNLSAWAITPEQLQKAAEAMLAHGYKPSAVNRDLSALGSAYKWARAERKSPRGFQSPTLAVRRFNEPIRRVHVEPEQLEALRVFSLTHPDRRFAVFVALLIDTGARKSELLERRWSEFDLDRGEVLAPMTKNGTPRVLFFRRETADLIRRVCPKREAGALAFQGRRADQPISYRKAWEQATRDAGVPSLRMHDVRHTKAAALLRSGVTLPIAAQVLGHDPAVLARRYGHLETGALRRAQQQAWEAERSMTA